ncbi:MAG: hypothetical protein HQ564_08095, partial [Candidatus Saganbacteria bacterium]|nr:hypothetical protein [Candidatus Saganbacteria bacterium]
MQGVSGTTLRHPQPHSGKVFVARRLGAVLRDNNVKPQNNGMRRFLDLRLPAECVLNLTGLIKKHNISEINIHERTSEECLLRILEQDKSPDLLVIGSQIRISQSSLSEILQEEGIRVSGLKGILSSVWVTLSVRKALEEILAEEGIKEVTVQTIAKSDFSDAAKIKNILTSKIIGEELILFAGETTTGVDLPTSKLEAKDLLLAIIGFNQSIKNRGETFDRYQGKFAQFVKKDPQRIAQAFFGQVDNPLLKKRSDQALKMLQKNLVGLADHEINCALLDEFQKIGSDDSQELLIELSRYLANIFPANESYPSYEEGILEEQAEKGIIGKIEYLEQVCLLKSTFLEAYRQTHGIKGKIKKKRKGSIPKAERIILKLEGNLHKKESELRAARLKERATMEEIWQSAIKRKNEEVLLTLMDSYVGFYFIVEKIKSNKISPFSLMRIFKLAEKKEEEGLRLLALERLFEILK